MSAREGDIGKRIRLRWGNETPRSEGVMLAHSLVPMVLIEADDGSRTWWRHDMADPIEENS